MDKEVFLRDFMEEIWNKKNFAAVEKYVHSEYKIHLDNADPWEGKTLSHKEFKDRLNYSFGSFPDIHFEITSAIPDVNQVAITWIMTGTNIGKIGEFAPTNQKIKTNGMTIYHFYNNKIAGHSQVFDRLTIMKQLGFV